MQVLPVPQTVPHVPQFWLSLCGLVQVLPHCIWPELQEVPVPPDPPRNGAEHDSSDAAAIAATKRKKRVLGGVSFILSLPELHGPPVPAHGHLTAPAPIGQALSFSGNNRAPKLTTLASSMFHWS